MQFIALSDIPEHLYDRYWSFPKDCPVEYHLNVDVGLTCHYVQDVAKYYIGIGMNEVRLVIDDGSIYTNVGFAFDEDDEVIFKDPHASTPYKSKKIFRKIKSLTGPIVYLPSPLMMTIPHVWMIDFASGRITSFRKDWKFVTVKLITHTSNKTYKSVIYEGTCNDDKWFILENDISFFQDCFGNVSKAKIIDLEKLGKTVSYFIKTHDQLIDFMRSVTKGCYMRFVGEGLSCRYWKVPGPL